MPKQFPSFIFFHILLSSVYILLFSVQAIVGIDVCIDWLPVSRSLASFHPLKCFHDEDDDGIGALVRAGNVRYILYDVKVGEGFNLQKEVFYRVGVSIMALNKKSIKECENNDANDLCSLWVLVLPPWCRLAHWEVEDNHTHLPWSVLFQKQVMQSMVPVLEYDEFYTYSNFKKHQVDFSAIFKFSHDRELIGFNRTRDISTCESKYNNFVDEEICDTKTDTNCSHPYRVGYSGYCRLLETKQQWCYEVYFLNGETAARAIWDTVSNQTHLHTLFIKGCDNFLVPWPTELSENNIIEALYPSDLVRSFGDLFIQSIAPDGRFIGSHVRRGDFLRHRLVPTIQFISRRLCRLMEKLNMNVAFVCSDGTVQEKTELQQFVNAHNPKYKLHYFTNNMNHPGLKASIEQWIATRSSYFIGTNGSRYSSAIRWERIFMGKSFNDTGDTYCLTDKAGNEPDIDAACPSVAVHDPTEFIFRSGVRKIYF